MSKFTHILQINDANLRQLDMHTNNNNIYFLIKLGIMISPYSGIYNKENFEMTIINNKIGIYLAKTEL